MPGVEDLPNVDNLPFVESLYGQFLRAPDSVPAEWRAYFERLSRGNGNGHHPEVEGPSFRPRSIFNPPGAAARIEGAGADLALQDRVDQLVRAFRVRGHKVAQLDPLGLPREQHPELDLAHYGLTEADLDKSFSARTLSGPSTLTLREIIERLRRTYCGPIGVQFMHIDDLQVKAWLQERMESTQNQLALSREEQLRILTKLTDAEIFEQFLHSKFVGAKRFSLEGGESLIPLLDLAIEAAAEHGAREMVIGMAHRGRLNVLANIMGKSPAQIFREFADRDPDLHFGRGDVKYHLGYSSDRVTSSGRTMHLSLCFNPSHLEFVSPVVIGRVRAKQDRHGDVTREHVVPLVIHGDAAFAGQGIVQETLNMSELAGYRVGGSIHVIINNQIGFTTPPESSRSSYYPSDVARMLDIPIFHVNGEHPEAVAQVIRLALDFRERFQKDVVIDMWCYRRYGHNEGDDPAFTQPVMYAHIRQRKSVREGYLDNLLRPGEISREEAEEIGVRRRQHLEDALSEARKLEYEYTPDYGRGIWAGYLGGADEAVPDVDTGVPKPTLERLLRSQAEVPADFSPHPKVTKLLQTRAEMAAGEKPLDWGTAEGLAFATLLTENVRVRLSGQDSARGTFSHRHAVLHDYRTGARYIPLNHLEPDQAKIDPIDSPLSEQGVLAFDYGYSLDTPDALVIWEAQFGDFVNGAQVIIDQFIVSSEDKWHRLSGLVLLLPHGFEGQGPEHSSARLERWLGLCAEDNIQVCYPTTPAQMFHLLRRQVHRPLRKPLVVATPKSLLRHPQAVSSLDDLTTGTFRRILPDPVADPAKVRRVMLCSGKIYYDLVHAQEVLGAEDVAIIRVEQLYPLRPSDLAAALAPFAAGTPVLWVQEEPANMGAWPFLQVHFKDPLLGRHPFRAVTRAASASPATGSAVSHRMEQELLIEHAFELL
jgi:2-oxoglutarate dehydrogenase E1 component